METGDNKEEFLKLTLLGENTREYYIDIGSTMSFLWVKDSYIKIHTLKTLNLRK